MITVVVIAILAAISLIAYTDIQGRARDSQRHQDIKAITQALELYYVDNGKYPDGGGCSPNCVINNNWSTTSDDGWEYLSAALVPEYISTLPKDPKSDIAYPLSPRRYGYSYFSHRSVNYCGVGPTQMYILVYEFESQSQENTLRGECTGTAIGYSGKSNYRIVKDNSP